MAISEGQQIDTLPVQVYGDNGDVVKIGAVGDALKVTDSSAADKLATIDATLETLKNLISQMQGVASDLRVTILSGTVTSVGTVSNQTQIGGQPATLMVQNTMDNLAVISNIQNIVES